MSAYFKRTGLRMALASGFVAWLLALTVIGASPPPAGDADRAPGFDAAARDFPQGPVPTGGPDYVGMDTCLSCHDPEGAVVRQVSALSRGRRQDAGGGQQLRELPWPRQKARGSRRSRDRARPPKLCQASARRGQPALHELPQPGRSRALGRQPARVARAGVHDLPQPARREVGDEAAEGQHPDGNVRERAIATRSRSSIDRVTCRCARARWSVPPATIRTGRPTNGCCARATPSPKCARRATRRSAGRICGSTRRRATAA